MATPAIKLRPYQQRTVLSVLESWDKDPRSRELIVAPTGAGKTIMAQAILRAGRSPVCLVHTNTLLEQTKACIRGAWVVSLQSAVRDSPRGERIRSVLQRADVAFFDEAHHLTADEWGGAAKMVPSARMFGATATPRDGMGDTFDRMTVAASYSELVAAGNLCPCDVVLPEIARNVQRAKKIRVDGVRLYLEHHKTPEGRVRPAIYFDLTVAKCKEAAERLTSHGLRCQVISHSTGREARQRAFRKFDSGQLDVLCSPMALAEGFDSPRAEVCILARMCEWVGTFLQCVGRVLRPHPGKNRALLIDCTNACSVHGRPTDNREYTLDGKGIAPEGEAEAEEREFREREEAQMVAAKWKLMVDGLQERFEEAMAKAEERGWSANWAAKQTSRATGLDIPRCYPSKYQSTCTGCRKRVTPPEPIFWVASGEVWHPRCWFDERVREDGVAWEAGLGAK